MTNVLAMLQDIFEVCIVPLLAVLTTYLVKFIKAKSSQIAIDVDNETAQKYIQMLSDTITTCVISTNQSYVEALKKKGAFTLDAQKEAFQMTLDSVMEVLSEEAKKYLTEVYGDLNTYITKQIEASVNQNKITVEKTAE